MSRLFTFLGFVLFIQVPIFAQFDGIVGTEGCKAIEYKDSRFIDWAKTCVVTRGKVDIAKPDKGLVSFGKEENAIGAVNRCIRLRKPWRCRRGDSYIQPPDSRRRGLRLCRIRKFV